MSHPADASGEQQLPAPDSALTPKDSLSSEMAGSQDGKAAAEAEGTRGQNLTKQKKPLTWNRILIWIGAALVALYFIGDGVIGLIKSEPALEQPTVTVTETASEPTPASDPIDRGETSAFGAALPDSSRQFVLTEFGEASDWNLGEVLEKFRAVYSGESDGATTNIEVYAAQFEGADAAKAAFADRTGTGVETESGAVKVGDAETGVFLISKAEEEGQLPPVSGDTALPAGTVRVLWTNGTALFEAYGPESEISNFYKAFPL